MHYVVYGAGAVGGVIGARLHLAGIPTTLVARGAHLEAIRARGLAVETRTGREAVDVTAVPDAGAVPWTGTDVVLLTVKSHQSSSAHDDLVAHAPPGAPIVVAQNGVANERAALRRFANVYGICVMQPCAHLEPGVVVQQCHPVPGILDVGRYPTGVDATAEAIAADLRSAGFVAEPRPDIMAWKHRKLIMNIGNGIQACYRPGPEADRLQEIARAEGETVLEVAGIPVVTDEQDVARRGDILRGRTRDDYYGSTWQSVTRGHDGIETDWLNGEIVLLGRLHGVPAPANELLQHETNRLAREGGPPRSLDPAAALAALGEQ
jgi:2-dehydropantoate 2-reductase